MKLLEALYIKVFVNLVVTKQTTEIYTEYFSKGNVIDSFEKSFDTTIVSEEMVDYIETLIKESPYFYISLLDVSSEQGAVPTCLKTKMNLYHDMSDCEYKCQNKKWTHYTSKNDLYDLEKRYSTFGLDFVFSPFSLLSKFFSDKIDHPLALYILLEESYLTVGVFENSQLLFADFVTLSSMEEKTELVGVEALEEELDADDGIDLDDIDALDDLDDLDDIESLDDFGDIEDLDSIDDIDEFAESEDIEEEFHHDENVEENSPSDNINVMTDDYKRFSLLQESINKFYTHSEYNGDFIENVYVADSIGTSSDFKRYFEEEMFMSVYIRKITLAFELAKLAHDEVL